MVRNAFYALARFLPSGSALGHVAVIVAIAGLASGCASPNRGDDIAAQQDKMETLRDQQDDQFSKPSGFTVSDEVYIGSGEEVDLTDEAKLPPALTRTVTLVDQPMGIGTFGEKVAELANMPVRFGRRSLKEGTGSTQSVGGDSTNNRSSQGNQGAQEPSSLSGERFDPNYEGSLVGLLDQATSRFNIFWRYQDGAIEFYKYATETFSVPTFPGVTTIENTLTNTSETQSSSSSGGQGSSASQQGGESSQEFTTEATFNPWNEAVSSIGSMLSSNGKVSANPSSGAITVTDTPEVLDRVETFIGSLGEHLNRQVAIKVDVFTLELNQEASAGIDLNATFQDAASQYGATINGANPDSLSGTGSLTATILSGAQGGLGQWSGTDIVVEALRQHGDVSKVTSASGIALNNQALPLQDLRRRSYLKAASTTNTQTGSQTELEPGQIVTGFSLNATPHILDDRILLQYQLTLSQLRSMNQVQSNQNMIQTPDTTSRSFAQRVSLKNGSTLVVSGFRRSTIQDKEKVGAMGVSQRTEDNQQMVFITLTVNRASARPSS